MDERTFADLTLREFVTATASRQPAPGGGVVAAMTVASAAALVAMGARFAGGETAALANGAEALAARALALAEEDARAYAAVLEAVRRPVDRAGGDASVRRALAAAADVPLDLLAVACEVATIGVQVAGASTSALRGDVETGVLLAGAAGHAAARLVGINLDQGAPDAGRSERTRDLVTVLTTSLGALPPDPSQE